MAGCFLTDLTEICFTKLQFYNIKSVLKDVCDAPVNFHLAECCLAIILRLMTCFTGGGGGGEGGGVGGGELKTERKACSYHTCGYCVESVCSRCSRQPVHD